MARGVRLNLGPYLRALLKNPELNAFALKLRIKVFSKIMFE
jgi:hypothetical protein